MASPIVRSKATKAKKSPKHVYSIVEFQGNYKESIVEIVPQSWVRSIKGQMLCKYPLKKDQDHLNGWIKNCSDTKESWRHYKVVVLQKSGNLVQGERRLARFKTTLQITESTKDEAYTDPKVDVPVPLSETEENDLFRIPGCVTSDEEESSSSSSDAAVQSSTDEPELEITPQQAEKRKPITPSTSGKSKVSRQLISNPSRRAWSTPKSLKRQRAMERRDADDTSSGEANTPPAEKKNPLAKNPPTSRNGEPSSAKFVVSQRVQQRNADRQMETVSRLLNLEDLVMLKTAVIKTEYASWVHKEYRIASV